MNACGKTISTEGVPPQTQKISILLNKRSLLKSEKASRCYLGFVKDCRHYFPRMAEQLNPFDKLLRAETVISITSKLKETFDSVNKLNNDACKLTIKWPSTGMPPVLVTAVSFRRVVYAPMIENNPEQKTQLKLKIYAPVAFGSFFFRLHNSNCQYTRKISWQRTWHFSCLHKFVSMLLTFSSDWNLKFRADLV